MPSYLLRRFSKPDYPTIPSVCRRDNVIFIHVPKAAGSTINLSMYGFRIGHRSIQSYWRKDPEFTNIAFKFSFVRHPYLRFLSAYNFLKSGGMSLKNASYVSDNIHQFSSLRTLAEAAEERSFRNSIIHLVAQTEFLSIPFNSRYSLYMDYIGKTEFLNGCIDTLRGVLPEHLFGRLVKAKSLKMNASSSYSIEIDKELFRKIRILYQDDFEAFGYDEWGTPELLSALISNSFNN